MNPFLNDDVIEIAVPLKDAHFPFPRGEELFKAMSWCVTDYYIKARIGKPFEARGIMVTGESRQGKSHEIDRLLQQFNDGSVVMPDGRPAKIILHVVRKNHLEGLGEEHPWHAGIHDFRAPHSG